MTVLSELSNWLPMAYNAALLVPGGWGRAMKWLRPRRRRRGRQMDVEPDPTSDQLRMTILALAEQLGADAHEARKALIRESYLARGRECDDTD